MTVLVTGSTGLLGANLVRKLLEKGEKVRVLIRETTNTIGIDGLDVEKVYGDIRDYPSVLKAIDGCEYVYHVAAYTDLTGSRELAFQINFRGTVNVAKACMEVKVKKMVYASTASVVGWGTMENPATEDTPFNLDFLRGTSYVDSKMAAEKKILEYYKEGLPVVITNPCYMLGPWDTKVSSGQFIVMVAKGLSMFYTDGGANLIDVEDAALGHILAMEKGRCGERYIIGNENVYTKDFLTMVNKYLGKKPPTIHVPYSLAMVGGYLCDFISLFFSKPLLLSSKTVQFFYTTHFLSPEKARKELGLPQSSVEEAIEKEIKWLRDYNYI